MGKQPPHGPGPPETAAGPAAVWRADLRRRAENRVPAEPDLAELSDTAHVAELLHELRVQQIELEVQNEELRRSQLEVEQARDRYFDLYDSAPIAYVTLDPMGVILDVNHTTTVLLGVPLEQLVQSKLKFLIRRADDEILERHLADVFAGRARQVAEIRFRRADGREVATRLESLAIVREAGLRSRCRTAIIDITELRRKEAAMRRLATAVADSDDAIFTLDFDGRIQSWNRGARELFGLPEKEAMGESFLRVVPAEGHGEFRAILRRLAGGARIRTVDAERVAADGRAMVVSMTASPLRGSDGPAHAASFTERDVTARRRAEAALAERELRLRAVVDAALEGIVVVDQDGRIEELNPSAARMFAYTLAEARGAPLDLLLPALYRPPGADDPGSPREPAMSLVIGSGRMVKGQRKGGSEFPAQVAVCEMKLADRLLYCAFVRDLSSEAELQEELRQSQKMEVLGALAGGIAHDFNNVLQAIAGNAGLALERMPPGDSVTQWIEKCQRAALQGGQLTHRLLAFQRKGSSARRPIDIDRVIESYSDLARHFLGDDIRLEITPGAPRSAVMAEEGHLEQILLNLVVNARDAMPNGGGAIAIETDTVVLDEEKARALGLGPAAHHVRLSVRDSGRGMDAETRKRLFEPFFTTKESGQGTGLGLSIVHTIVEQLGGRVEVVSNPGDGTRFLFHFPAVEARAVPDAEAQVAQSGRRVRVLLADDDPRVREVVESLLTRMGHEVTSADGGTELLRLIEGRVEPPDLLVTDVMMPEMSGPALAEAVRRRFPGIRVLFMSGVSAAWLVAEGRIDPAERVMVKPFDQKVLGRRIDEIMRGGAQELETILLVDDSESAREALGDILSESGYRVLAAASLAEARVLARQDGVSISFLLTDIRLPDGQGQDLARELTAVHPEMRNFFMSGSVTVGLDPESPFFSKPVDVDALLTELERPR